jgi:hypothetical protein
VPNFLSYAPTTKLEQDVGVCQSRRVPPSEADGRGISPRWSLRGGKLILVLAALIIAALTSLALLGTLDLSAHSVEHLSSASANRPHTDVLTSSLPAAETHASLAPQAGVFPGAGSFVLLCLCVFLVTLLVAVVAAGCRLTALPVLAPRRRTTLLTLSPRYECAARSSSILRV